MPDMGYGTDGLRQGATGHGEAAFAADAAATTLAGFAVAAGAFGSTASAPSFAGGLEAARLQQGRGAGTEAAGRAGLALRVALAAGLGDGLTQASTAVAASVPARGQGQVAL
jgi:hypothetical protein